MTVKVYQTDFEDSVDYSIGKFDPVKNLEKYIHVADLDVETLDEAFEVGNIGPESYYTRYAPMHSVSVGDILELNGKKYVVASFGFNELNQ